MPILAVTTIVRSAAIDERSSRVYLVDSDAREVVGEVAIPEDPMRESDANPRGGFRGTRGMASRPDRFAVATGSRIYLFDREWNMLREVDHPSLGGIHDLCGDPDGIWIASTGSDLLGRIDWEGNVTALWHWASAHGLSKALGFRRPPKFDPDTDYRLSPPGIRAKQSVHLNTVIRTKGGLLLGFGKVRNRGRALERARSGLIGSLLKLPGTRQAVTRISERRRRSADRRAVPVPQDGMGTHAIVKVGLSHDHLIEGAELLFTQDTATPNHNLLERDGLIYFNDSDEGLLRGIDPANGQTVSEIAVPGEPSFARGLCELADGRVAVGSQRPAAIYLGDIGSEEWPGTVELGSDPRETVYAICEVPVGFTHP